MFQTLKRNFTQIGKKKKKKKCNNGGQKFTQTRK
jgi:hypothetical protein